MRQKKNLLRKLLKNNIKEVIKSLRNLQSQHRRNLLNRLAHLNPLENLHHLQGLQDLQVGKDLREDKEKEAIQEAEIKVRSIKENKNLGINTERIEEVVRSIEKEKSRVHLTQSNPAGVAVQRNS